MRGQPFKIDDFVRESNRIEGIFKINIEREIDAHEKFLRLDRIGIGDLAVLVDELQPGAVPRFTQGRDVRVGSHIPPSGGPHVMEWLQRILDEVNGGTSSPWASHVEYETLHPFTDGNGRSGRALWLWCMGGMHKVPLGFLHHFYYQTLSNVRHEQ